MILVCSACHYMGPKHFIYLGVVTKNENTFLDDEPLRESTELYACPECGTLRIGSVPVGQSEMARRQVEGAGYIPEKERARMQMEGTR